ncbi:MAG: glycosyltransferase family 2 protein [Chitinophagales bacterium]|nr:glycosyltransferase family 2 protein [Chitinophagales bacterium]
MPRVSILIPAYNAERFIARTIESVLTQTYTDWELIIVDDKSSDNTFQIAKQYESKYPDKISVFQNEINLGMLQNWNRGIELCNKELFVKLDADDIWLPSFLEKSVAILDSHPEVGIVFTKFVNIDGLDNIIPGSEISLPDFAVEKPFSTIPLVQLGQDKMLQYQILRQGLSAMRRIIFDKIGNYRFLLTKETQAATDTEFYFRVGLHYSIFCISETLYRYRVHETSISKTDTDNQLSSKKMYEIKMCILNYYYQQEKINTPFYKNNVAQIQFNYNLFLIQKFRKEKNIRKTLSILFKTLLLSPVKTITFYFKRYQESE